MELSEAIHLLGDLLGQVLIEQESRALFEIEEQVRAQAKAARSEDPAAAAKGERQLAGLIGGLDAASARSIASAFALYFDLVNTAEDNARMNVIRQEALSKAPEPVHDSIDEAIQLLKASGLTETQMAELLENLHIELVLTAHPTEARRRTVLSKIARIADALRALGSGTLLPREQDNEREALYHEITTLWLTDRSRTAQPTPTDEVRTALYFVGQVFWKALPEVYQTLQGALDRYYPGLSVDHPWLRLASWMGGDRDGNPNVTAAMTAETLHLHRGMAIENHRASLQDLSRRFSINAQRAPLPEDLRAWLSRRPILPAHAAQIQRRYPDEPYRLVLSLLANDLGEASQDDMKSRLLSDAPHTARITETDLAGPLKSIARAVPPAVAQGPLETTLQQLDIFGLYGARLDTREESSRLNAALGEVLRGLGLEPHFEALDAPARQAVLERLLAGPQPALAQHPGITPEGAETWALFQLINRARDVYGAQLMGPFIISMCTSPADVLAVLLMANWTGCADGLQIVPLFETIQDLENAAQVMEALFDLPAYAQHLQTCPDGQMVMVGYSDSNKDGGYLMSNWALYQAQEQLAVVCAKRGIKLTLFHGRGGTTARGGGPANRAILAQPGGSVAGRYRLTEQGEILSTRYSTIDMALRNLEQMVNAVLLASAPVCLVPDPHITDGCSQRVSPQDLPAPWRSAMQSMSQAARQQYHRLVFETPGFVDYWHAATPIAEIKRMRIGSRPAARRPGPEQINKIRAIPWVFSWMQSRFNLPGWYGLGTGLAALRDGTARGNEPKGMDWLQDMYESWPFFRVLLENAELSLSKADMRIAAMYDTRLVPDRALSQRIFGEIQAEYERSVELVLAIKGQDELMQAEPVIQHSVKVRNPYVDPLNYIQVEMLSRLRALPDPEGDEAESLREVIVMTINGIAAGLRNTG